MAYDVSGDVGVFAALARKIAPLVGVAALIAGLFVLSSLTVDPQLRVRNAELNSELAAVRARNARLRAKVEATRAEITRLRTDPDESLYHARTGLGLVRSGEVTYRFETRPSSANDAH